jgi:hypothetical protein
MFVVSDSAAAAIRTAMDQSGELGAAAELRRLYPGIRDFAHAGIVNLVDYTACAIVRQYGAELHAAIWTHVSCRHTRKASARARRY